MSKITSIMACMLIACVSGSVNATVTIDWAIVGNPGNLPDHDYFGQGQFGAVANTYRIGKYEVINEQYAEFLNAVDPGGSNVYGIYGGGGVSSGIVLDVSAPNGAKYSIRANMGNKPANHVSFFSCMRFANWLQNGQGTGSTESGTYSIGNGLNEIRNPDATYFIPNENEWYKAAYYQPSTLGGDTDDYWLYPTRSNTVPTVATANTLGDISNPGPNVANYSHGAVWYGEGGYAIYRTTVGSAGPLSASFYGTFDQGGNIFEWNESVLGAAFRGARGGDWDYGDFAMAASFRGAGFPDLNSPLRGCRVASVPEPFPGLIGLLATVWLRQRRVADG